MMNIHKAQPTHRDIAVESSTLIDRRNDTLALSFGLLAFCLHALFAARYDLFRDELYFIVCGRHPAFGYADQPPLTPLVAAGLYALGKGVWLMRLPVALAAGALAWLAVRFARLLGGGVIAASGAAICVTIAPLLMGLGATLNTTAFDPLAWTSIAWCLVYAVKTGRRRTLWLCGLIAGVDLEIKYALVFWGFSLAVGLALTAERKLLARKDLWIGVALAAIIAGPSLIWQALHGFPFLELAAAAHNKNADNAPLAFMLNQVLIMNPFLAPVWLSGLIAPFVIERLRPVRFLAISFITCVLLVILTHGKDYYLAACYPVVFIIGAVAIAHAARSAAGHAALIGWAIVAVTFSAWISPLALPILPVPLLRSYIQRFPFKPQQQEKIFKGTLLPQVFADQLGWRDFTSEVGGAWAQIPAAERARTAIKVDNYGEAAALDVYGVPFRLPPALSGHNQYFLWGLRGQHPANLLVVQNHPERLAPYCHQATVLATTSSPDAMAYENGRVIAYCRGLKVDLATIWPQLKNYN
jgi:4-amino-4-deoxy-L-arabinose transferase-like glycosyltransferase